MIGIKAAAAIHVPIEMATALAKGWWKCGKNFSFNPANKPPERTPSAIRIRISERLDTSACQARSGIEINTNIRAPEIALILPDKMLISGDPALIAARNLARKMAALSDRYPKNNITESGRKAKTAQSLEG